MARTKRTARRSKTEDANRVLLSATSLGYLHTLSVTFGGETVSKDTTLARIHAKRATIQKDLAPAARYNFRPRKK
ncbi:hypothetical protein B0H14DRAFT_3867529 [Mycena olivaceomarginata]|nr:hypothetical protein B0H14DRAFT_3867529 [Mycena olivaceomarginata]